MFTKKVRIIVGLVAIPALAVLTLARCAKNDTTATGTTSSKYIYVASGNTYAGNLMTTSTPANVITRFESSVGTFDRVIADYTVYPGDTPVGMINFDNDNLLVLVENPTNTASRRIDKVRKDGYGFATYLTNASAFTGANTFIVNDLASAYDGGLLVAKGQVNTVPSSIEKFNASNARVTLSGRAYVQSPAGSCANTNNRIQHVTSGPNGHIIAIQPFLAQNRIIMVNREGYNLSGDCKAIQAAPTTNHYPTALLYHTSGKLIVGYGHNVAGAPIHEVYSYDVSDSAGFSNAVTAWSNLSVIQGASAIAEQVDDHSVLISSAAAGFNTIEKFTFDSTTGVLTRVGTTPLIQPSVYTRSVSAILAPSDTH